MAKKKGQPAGHVVLPLDSIRPYWRNPRVITDEAVNAVAKSIEEYGYQQPIVVDTENVIIIGHTRYIALRRLGVEQVPVLVADLPAYKAKELRVVDNRTHEYTSWDFENLLEELKEFDDTLRVSYFPEVLPEDLGKEPDPEPVPEEINDPWERVDTEVEFVCPACFHEFVREVTKEEIMSGTIHVKEEEAANG